MKCFHFTKGERKSPDSDHAAAVRSSAARVSWARSLSIASSSSTSTSTNTNTDLRRSDLDSLTQHHGNANDLRGFTFADLKSATRGFSRSLLIGEGGFGSVFKGVVNLRVRVRVSGDIDESANSKMDVAIKQLNRYGFQGHKEWVNEVNWLGVIKHPNLVRLVGYCAEDDERGIQRLLVYELMKNKSLEDHLLGRLHSPLPWMVRLKIAQDAARGLSYLHEGMDFQLIFRDFKTSNVLLDEDFNAKLSDFGLARLGPAQGFSHVSTSVVGTVGYAAPEYVLTGKLTIKSDVWSFGVVLYELITGRRAVEKNLPRSEQLLLDWVKPFVSDSKKFHLIVDQRLEGDYCKKSAERVASLANKCLSRQPKNRPKMSEVVEILGDIIEEEEGMKEDDADEDENESGEEGETEGMKPSVKNYLRKVLEIKERVNLRNKSIGKLDWKNWTPGGLVRS